MAKRVCNGHGCPNLVDRDARDGRCPACQRTRDKARGTRHERGYDTKHDRLRARWAPKVASGRVNCWRCGKRITIYDVWHLGHCDDDRTTYHGPEHESCNTGARGPCPHPSHN